MCLTGQGFRDWTKVGHSAWQVIAIHSVCGNISNEKGIEGWSKKVSDREVTGQILPLSLCVCELMKTGGRSLRVRRDFWVLQVPHRALGPPRAALKALTSASQMQALRLRAVVTFERSLGWESRGWDLILLVACSGEICFSGLVVLLIFCDLGEVSKSLFKNKVLP